LKENLKLNQNYRVLTSSQWRVIKKYLNNPPIELGFPYNPWTEGSVSGPGIVEFACPQTKK